MHAHALLLTGSTVCW